MCVRLNDRMARSERRVARNLIVTNPNTTTHAKLKPEEKAALGITEGLIRISVGLEDIEDLIEDFTHAVEVSVKSDILE